MYWHEHNVIRNGNKTNIEKRFQQKKLLLPFKIKKNLTPHLFSRFNNTMI